MGGKYKGTSVQQQSVFIFHSSFTERAVRWSRSVETDESELSLKVESTHMLFFILSMKKQMTAEFTSPYLVLFVSSASSL